LSVNSQDDNCYLTIINTIPVSGLTDDKLLGYQCCYITQKSRLKYEIKYDMN